MIISLQLVGCTANPKEITALAINDGTGETVTFIFTIAGCAPPISVQATFGPDPNNRQVVKAGHSCSGTRLVTVSGGGQSSSLLLDLDNCS